MEKQLKDQLHNLYLTYTAISQQFNRIETEAARLEEERKAVSTILHDTREQEKNVINKLEEILDRKLNPNDILEIIKQYE
jgi:hypothetical protein